MKNNNNNNNNNNDNNNNNNNNNNSNNNNNNKPKRNSCVDQKSAEIKLAPFSVGKLHFLQAHSTGIRPIGVGEVLRRIRPYPPSEGLFTRREGYPRKRVKVSSGLQAHFTGRVTLHPGQWRKVVQGRRVIPSRAFTRQVG